MEKLKKQVNFIAEIEKLKTIKRFNRTLDGRFENSAEHSWQLALTAVILKDYYPKKLDMEKVMLLLLLHDLGEIYAGDTWAFDEEKKTYSHENELNSIEKSLSFLPESQHKQMKALWLEFEKGDSNEARFSRVIDALVPLINHLTVSDNNYNPDNISAETVLEKKKFIATESEKLWVLTKELVEESVNKGLYL
ncbi:HD domain-containing protein [Streptococcus zalophi]|uniref:5'-deoxynucleotidase n=1 Tax=Streptococcus zalophi TaxID=640031 RepID=A0A934P8B8_9STRE|nr:HD domain-containing protein [Streptococcus zalophi]MBJ8349121.1 HD domain-containing protein [Streptococcus zalophi]MCR8967727.1 HD domain-containing protein [Streptococcus zalophi]